MARALFEFSSFGGLQISGPLPAGWTPAAHMVYWHPDQSMPLPCRVISPVATRPGFAPFVPMRMPVPLAPMAAPPHEKSGDATTFNKKPAVAEAMKPKRRFCATYPNIGRCRQHSEGQCEYAHSRDELQTPTLTDEEEARDPDVLDDEFFMERYKTLWCPVGRQHDWQLCMYAHTYQDARRPPSIGYGSRSCPHWTKQQAALAYTERCPNGLRCPYSHGAKEQLYHPDQYRTLTCQDTRSKKCARRLLCAFYHEAAERRTPTSTKLNYSLPLSEETFPNGWAQYFLSPLHFEEMTAMSIAANANDMMFRGRLPPTPSVHSSTECARTLMGGRYR